MVGNLNSTRRLRVYEFITFKGRETSILYNSVLQGQVLRTAGSWEHHIPQHPQVPKNKVLEFQNPIVRGLLDPKALEYGVFVLVDVQGTALPSPPVNSPVSAHLGQIFCLGVSTLQFDKLFSSV